MRWIEWNRRMNDGRMDIQAGQEISSERKMKMKRILRFLCMFHPRRSSAVTCLCRSSSLRTHFMNRIFVAQFSKKVFFLAKITLYRYFFHRLTRKFAVQAHRARRDIDFRQFSRIFLVSRKSFESNESLRVCARAQRTWSMTFQEVCSHGRRSSIRRHRRRLLLLPWKLRVALMRTIAVHLNKVENHNALQPRAVTSRRRTNLECMSHGKRVELMVGKRWKHSTSPQYMHCNTINDVMIAWKLFVIVRI